MPTLLRGLPAAVSEGQPIVELPGSFTHLGHDGWLGVTGCVLLARPPSGEHASRLCRTS
ncbi:hypothetical protein [Streptomyces sp. NPDC058486]|uniref:hypothetical protein n=1 Tax=unclassified Streptomyces TaxID=2593676 RepID=UPI00365BF35F